MKMQQKKVRCEPPFSFFWNESELPALWTIFSQDSVLYSYKNIQNSKKSTVNNTLFALTDVVTLTYDPSDLMIFQNERWPFFL